MILISECDSSSTQRASRSSVKQLILLAIVCMFMCVPAWPITADTAPDPFDQPFRFDGELAQRAALTHTQEPVDPQMLPDAPMAYAVAGMIEAMDSRGLRRLERAIGRPPSHSDDAEFLDPPPFAWLHLFSGETVRSIALTNVGDERFYHARVEGDETHIFGLNRRTLDPLLAAGGTTFRGSFDPAPFEIPARPSQRSVVLLPPYEPSPITFDRATMKRRLYHGMNIVNPDTDRVLSDATIRVREPRNYDPRRPAGLLVWASPTPSGEIPSALAAAADDQYCVCVGVDDAGNEQSNQNKFQLIFDAMHNAKRQYHIDDQRVYITGLSGGGKVSSILTICFPDVFTGAIPIAGLATHATLPLAFDKHRFPYFAMPRGRMLMDAQLRPIASMTGPRDFNYVEMKARSARLSNEGFKLVRFFEYEDMGHEMPTPQRFADALRFIDTPYQQRHTRRQAQATLALTECLEHHDAARPPTKSEQTALLAIIREYPWTDAAWDALALLVPSLAPAQ